MPHRLRRLTSYAQDPQRSARRLYKCTHMTVCSFYLLPWQASLTSLTCEMRVLFNAVGMHAHLQGIYVAWAKALTIRHCSKVSSSTMGPIPACLRTSCRHSGMQSSICTWATLSSGLAANARSGGHVTDVQTVFHTSGRLLFSTEHMEWAVPFAQARLFVSTTRLPERHLKLRFFGTSRRIIPCRQTM